MSTGTGIEWTDCTWNPVVGCTRASAGCDHCYAVVMTHRLEAMGQEKYKGLTVLNPRGERHFNGVVRCDEAALGVPLTWKTPRRVFVNSMSDLFHKDVPFEFIDKVFAVMALCPRHTFQILTKRPERMVDWIMHRGPTYGHPQGLKDNTTFFRVEQIVHDALRLQADAASGMSAHNGTRDDALGCLMRHELPRNIWMGVSAERQQELDARVGFLKLVPAAVRFLSIEPLLGPMDLRGALDFEDDGINTTFSQALRLIRIKMGETPFRASDLQALLDTQNAGPGDGMEPNDIDWVIVGGESGAKARACDVGWVRGIVRQCRAAGVPVFVKQLGARPESTRRDSTDEYVTDEWRLKDRKGGEMGEWPEDLRVREMPGEGNR